ncbi:hypothetical protein [Dyadobacter alkalitolerans]|uniref:hypothetical protein n=1 Tax=Dyadobacter alkalitolerans TaxID=492736 RepID=UPI000405BE8A|nr:hypothetical protein [Dyadobacter alkalitolerans]
MALSIEQAKQIIDVVATDTTSFEKINSVFRAIPGGLGWAGTARNFGLWASELVGIAPEVSDAKSKWDCNAIAEATANAIKIKGALSSSFPAQTATSEARDSTTGSAHQGTVVTMRDGTKYVFDWHANLNVGNPFIYESMTEFNIGKGVPFSSFKGFK